MISTDAVQQIDTKAYANFWFALGLQLPKNSFTKRESWLTLLSNRRRYSRYVAGRKWSCRLIDQTGYKQAKLYDISQCGIAIDSKHEISVGKRITLRVESMRRNQQPFIINATVVHAVTLADNSTHRYGCVIDSIADVNLHKARVRT